MWLKQIDIVEIAAYLVVMLLIGIIFSKRANNTENYYNAGRSLGPFILMATVCATMLGGSSVIGRAGLAYTDGISAIAIGLPYPISMLIFSKLSKKIQKVGSGKYKIISIPHLMEIRFGKSTKLLSAIIIALAMAAIVSASVSATASILQLFGTALGISYKTCAVIATVVFVAYTMFSGLLGVVYTDVLQFIVLAIVVFVLMPVDVSLKGGGIRSVLATANDKAPNLFILKFNGRIISMLVTNLLSMFCSAEMWQRAFAAKTPQIAQKGMVLGAVSFLVASIIVSYLGIAGRVLFPNLSNPDSVLARLAMLLPTGILGIGIAGLIAITMSTADSYLLVSAQTIADDILKTIKPEIGDKQNLLIAKLTMPVMAFIALELALYAKSAYNAVMVAYSFYTSAMAFPALGALLWKKATKFGIISSSLGGLLTAFIWQMAGLPFGLGVTIPGCCVSFILLIIVSLITYKRHPSIYV